jgi:hypothetical protein
LELDEEEIGDRNRGGVTVARALVGLDSTEERRQGGFGQERAQTGARERRIVLSGPAFSRTRGDRRALPHSANAGAMGGDTEADRWVPPETISLI